MTSLHRCFRFLFVVTAVAVASLPLFAQIADETNQNDNHNAAQRLIDFKGHTTEVTSLAFHPNAREIVSASLKDVRIWNGKTGKETGTWQGKRGHAVAFSPDGRRLAISGFKVTNLYDASDMDVLRSIDVSPPAYSLPYFSAIAYSPVGKQFATAAMTSQVGGRHGLKAGLVQVWDAATGKELRRFDDLTQPFNSVNAMSSHPSSSITYSPDGKLLVAGTNGAGGELPEPGEIHVWDAASGERLHLLRAKQKVKVGEDRCAMTSVDISPDSKHLVTSSTDGIIRIWSLHSGEVEKTLRGHRGWVHHVVYSPDGTQLGSAGGGKFLSSGKVAIWKIRSR